MAEIVKKTNVTIGKIFKYSSNDPISFQPLLDGCSCFMMNCDPYSLAAASGARKLLAPKCPHVIA